MGRRISVLFLFNLFLTGLILHYGEVTFKSKHSDSLGQSNQIQKIFEELKAYRQYELLAQSDGDMGDTLQRTGAYYTLLHYLGVSHDDRDQILYEALQMDLNRLEAQKGYYRRSNHNSHWSSNPENCSRDQMMALQAAIVTFKDAERGRALFLQFLSRGFFNQNIRSNDAYPGQAQYLEKIADPPTPMQLSLLLRGLNNPWVYPAVFVLDMALIFDITLFRRLNKGQLWDSDIKELPNVIAANSYLPTPWSRLAISLYMDQRDDIENRVRYYNDLKFNGIPPLADLYVLTLNNIYQSESEPNFAFFRSR